MFETIDPDGREPMFFQVVNAITSAIASGRLKSGEQLPSVRELSERLQANPRELARAYRMLDSMGYIHIRDGVGIFVGRGNRYASREACQIRIAGHFEELVQDAKAVGMALEDLTRIVVQTYGNRGTK